MKKLLLQKDKQIKELATSTIAAQDVVVKI